MALNDSPDPARDEAIRRLAEAGVSRPTIARRLGVSRNVVRHTCERSGVSEGRRKSSVGLSTQALARRAAMRRADTSELILANDAAEAVTRLADGWSVERVAEWLGWTCEEVRERARGAMTMPVGGS